MVKSRLRNLYWKLFSERLEIRVRRIRGLWSDNTAMGEVFARGQTSRRVTLWYVPPMDTATPEESQVRNRSLEKEYARFLKKNIWTQVQSHNRTVMQICIVRVYYKESTNSAHVMSIENKIFWRPALRLSGRRIVLKHHQTSDPIENEGASFADLLEVMNLRVERETRIGKIGMGGITVVQILRRREVHSGEDC
uniref:SFRICE_015675 n=1 Tax=Spodoptera frugiperda TaxID=7108 RepID=A0A2H1VEV8_SPOFR